MKRREAEAENERQVKFVLLNKVFTRNHKWPNAKGTLSSFKNEESNPINFNLNSTYENHSPGNNLSNNELRPSPPQPSTSAPPMGSQRGPSKADQEHAHLANLFAAREDGVDTFGNYGQLRYGGTDAGRLVAQKTGAATTGGSSFNPFAQQQQQQQRQQGNDQPFFSI